VKVSYLGGLFSRKLIVQRDWRKTLYKLASKFTQFNSVSSSVDAYARCPLTDTQNRSKCYLGVYVFLAVKLLDTIYQSIDLFSNGIGLRYIFSSMDANAGVGIYARCCLHYIFIDQT